MDELLVNNWLGKCERLSHVIPHVVFKTKREDIPLPYGVRDIYRVFVLSRITKDQRLEINSKLELFSEKYPDVLLKIFTKSGDLRSIKKVYADALMKMEKSNAYQEIIDICNLIAPLIAKEQGDNFRFHYDIQNAMGKAQYSLGFFRKAIEYYQKAFEIAIEKKWAESNPLGWIGVAYFNLSQYNEAIDHLQKAYWIAKTFKEGEKIECFWLGSLGNAYRGSRQFQDAMDCYNQALDIAKKIKDLWNESLWQNNIGNLYRDVNQSEIAKGYYEEAIKIAKEIPDKRLEARWKNNLANIYAELGEIDTAIKLYDEALTESNEVGDRQNVATCANNLGDKQYRKGDIDSAIKYSQKALEIVIDTRDRQSEKSYLNALLNIYSNSNQQDKAIEYLQQKLGESKSWGNRDDEEMWLGSLGDTYQLLGQVDKARKHYSQAIEIAEEIKDQDDQIRWINALYELDLLEIDQFYSTGQIDKALEKCNNLIINTISKDLKGIIEPLCEALRDKYPLENLDKEIETYRNEIENNPSESELYGHGALADCYARKGELAQAILEYKEAIKLNPSNMLTVLSMMEVNVWREGYKEAISIYQQWREEITSLSHNVIASWIICTALSLDGKPYEDYIAPLLDMEVNLSETNYSYNDILPYFYNLLEKGSYIKRLVYAWELHTIFTRHFIDPQIENILKNLIGGLPNEITVLTPGNVNIGLVAPDMAELPKELKDALNGILKGIAPSMYSPLFKAYMKRGLIYRMVGNGNLNMAIKDYIIATILNPISDEAYMAWGACLAQKGELEKAIPKYAMSISLNPGNKMAILGKMESEICSGRYDDATATYNGLGELTPKETVIAVSLVCISLALAGKPHIDFIDPLHDMEVKLSSKHDWCNVEIDRYLADLEKTCSAPERVTKAKEIQVLFKRHFNKEL